LLIKFYTFSFFISRISNTDMDIAPEIMSDCPRRYGMIARYNNGMRESWMRVADYLDEEIDYLLSRRDETQMSIANS